MDYPITTPKPRSVTPSYEHPSITNTTKSGRVQVSPDGPARLSFKLEYNRGVFVAGDDEMRPLWAFLNWCQGQVKTFDITLPFYSYGHGSVTAPGAAQDTIPAGNELYTEGWPPNTVVRKAGNFVQFGGGSRAYMLAADLVSDDAGEAVLTLCTPLLAPVLAAEAVVISGIKFRMRLDSNTASITQNPGRIQQLKSVGMVEDINA